MKKYLLACMTAMMLCSTSLYADEKHDKWIDLLSMGGGNSQVKGPAKVKFSPTKKTLIINQNGHIRKAQPGVYKLKNGKVIVVSKKGIAKYR